MYFPKTLQEPAKPSRMLAPKKRSSVDGEIRRPEPVKVGIFKESGDVILAFRSPQAHATLRMGARGARALAAILEKAACGDDEFDAEHALVCSLTVGEK